MSKYLCLVSLLLAVATVDSEMFTSKLMSSKTKYKDVASKDLVLPDGYTPLKAFFLIRHGTSSSTGYVNTVMRKGLRGIQKKIKEKAVSAGIPVKDHVKQLGKDVEEFMTWDWAPIPYSEKANDKDLTYYGRYEVSSFALRMRTKFPKIFGQKYNSDTCRVLSLFNARVRKSGQAFLETLYPEDTFDWKRLSYTAKDDYTLNEEKLKEEKDPNYDEYKGNWKKQEEAYKESEQFKEVRQRLANKLGLSFDEVVYEVVQFFWETCRWDLLGFDGPVVSCKFISNHDHEILLYYDELYWFNYVGPPANPFNYTLSCGVLHNLRDFLISDLSGPKSALFFANRSNIASIHFALGLVTAFKDFSSSMTTPFMANFVAVLFKQDNHPEKGLFVAFYINEHLLEVPMPDNQLYTLAPLSLVITKLDDYMASHCRDCQYKIPNFSV